MFNRVEAASRSGLIKAFIVNAYAYAYACKGVRFRLLAMRLNLE